MYDVARILTAFSGLVGWRQSLDPSADVLDSDLTGSTSGMYFNGEHPLMNYETLKGIAPNDSLYSYSTYDDTKLDYAIGDIVDDGAGLRYIRLVADTIQPLTNTTYWKRYYPFNLWLKNKTDEGIIQAVDDWYSLKSEMKTAKNVIAYRDIFTVDPHRKDEVSIFATGKNIAGIRITTARSLGLVYDIKKIGVQLAQDQSFDLKVFEVGVSAPIKTLTVNYTGAGDVQYFDLDIALETKKTYWIGYDKDTITGNVIDQSVYNRFHGTFSIESFNNTGSFTELWDTKTDQISSLTYGLTFDVSVRCDYTDIIINHKELFKSVIAKRVTINLLKELLSNPQVKVNRYEKGVSDEVLRYELDGDSQSTKGNNNSLNAQYTRALNAIMMDKSNIDKILLPPSRRGVKYKSQ